MGADPIIEEKIDSKQRIMEAVHTILESIGEDPQREGLVDTPLRVAKSYEEIFSGYSQDLFKVVNGALFDLEYENDEMIIVQDIPYYSMCEHHMLPFFGKAHVGYLASDKIIGLSKIPRIVEMFARRLQVQERLTNQIADAIDEVLAPLGVIVVIEGQHMCASLRGVKKHGVNMRTIATRGDFKNKELKDEFVQTIKK